ncbi:hypothetical protein FQS88_07120 [Enterococcus casseliflavus]|nr:hypothetical protein [Enterococcus casseliflavus]
MQSLISFQWEVIIIRKFLELEKDEQRDLANALAVYLSKFFCQDYYINEQDLRNDFDCFRKQDFFQDIVSEFEREHDVSIAFLVKNSKRIKLCKRCNEFFISFDTRNRQQICRKQIYVRFASDKFLNINKRSVCEMIQRQQKSIEWYRKQLLTESASGKSQ